MLPVPVNVTGSQIVEKMDLLNTTGNATLTSSLSEHYLDNELANLVGNITGHEPVVYSPLVAIGIPLVCVLVFVGTLIILLLKPSKPGDQPWFSMCLCDPESTSYRYHAAHLEMVETPSEAQIAANKNSFVPGSNRKGTKPRFQIGGKPL